MTITIDLDEETKKRLEMEAQIAGKPLEEYAAEVLKGGSLARAISGRPNLGWAKGLVQVSDDFDAPLDDFKDYM